MRQTLRIAHRRGCFIISGPGDSFWNLGFTGDRNTSHNGPLHDNPRNLLWRLRIHEQAAGLFLRDFRPPFDAIQAERGGGMTKAKREISGGYRTLAGNRSILSGPRVSFDGS